METIQVWPTFLSALANQHLTSDQQFYDQFIIYWKVFGLCDYRAYGSMSLYIPNSSYSDILLHSGI